MYAIEKAMAGHYFAPWIGNLAAILIKLFFMKKVISGSHFQLRLLLALILTATSQFSTLAQARTDTASFTISNARMENMGGALVTASRRLVLVSVSYPSRNL